LTRNTDKRYFRQEPYVRFATLAGKASKASLPLLKPPVSVLTSPIMHVQAHRAQVRKANFADEIADGISLRELSLYRAACHPASVMGCTARLDSVQEYVDVSGRRWIRDDDRPDRP
jgi:hypothetical protein